MEIVLQVRDWEKTLPVIYKWFYNIDKKVFYNEHEPEIEYESFIDLLSYYKWNWYQLDDFIFYNYDV